MSEKLFNDGKINKSMVVQGIIEFIITVVGICFAPKLFLLWVFGAFAYFLGVLNEQLAPKSRTILNWKWADLFGVITLVALTIVAWAIIL